jgi:hypothetical protein
MYAVAEKDCWDCFYDFEFDCFGDGICRSNLLPTKKLAKHLIDILEIGSAEIIEIEVNSDEEGIFFDYDNIWIK